MSGGMAVARNLKNLGGQDRLQDLTHLGGNSGGSWFAFQLLHSKGFYKNVTDPNVPIDTFMNDWLHKHVQAQADFQDPEGELQKEFGGQGPLDPGTEGGMTCAAYSETQYKVILPILSNIMKYPPRWLGWSAGVIAKQAIPDKHFNTATFDDLDSNLPEVTQIVQTFLPPDAWTKYNLDASHSEVNQLHATMKNGSDYDYAKLGQGLPLAFVSGPSGARSWLYNEDIKTLEVVTKCPYDNNETACQQAPYNGSKRPLKLSTNPLVAEIVASSGGWAGFMASPTAWYTIAQKIIDVIFSGLKYPLHPIAQSAIDCWPFGAQVMAPPVVVESDNRSVMNAEENTPMRYFDGVYADNTALPMTIAAIQRDCDTGKFDCSEPIKVILVNDGNISALTQGPPQYDSASLDSLRALFTDSKRKVGEYTDGFLKMTKVPVQTIFSESFPEEPEWKVYNNFPSKYSTWSIINPMEWHDNSTWTEKPILSKYYTRTLTTVDNKHYAVKGGMQIELLVFSLQFPGAFWPGVNDPDQRVVTRPGHLVMGDGAMYDKDVYADLIDGHAPMVKMQVGAMTPVLDAFFKSDGASKVYV